MTGRKHARTGSYIPVGVTQSTTPATMGGKPAMRNVKRYYKKKGSRYNKLNQVKNVSDIVEYKCIDVYSTLADVKLSNSEFFLLNGCAQGTGSDARLGLRTLMKSVRLNYMFKDVTGTGRADDFIIRTILFYDKEPQGADPTVAELLHYTVEPYGALSMPASTGKDRFDILADRRHCVCKDEDSGATPQYGQMYYKLNLPVHYNAFSTGDIDDINKGALFLFIMNDTATGTNASVNFYFQSRVLYTDV